MVSTHSSKSKPFLITTEIPEKRVKDLLCCGMEGGIGYWCQITDFVGDDEAEFKHLDYPFLEGHGVMLQDTETETQYLLDRDALNRGISLLPPHVVVEVMRENEDAGDGDIFVQLCLFGEVVYG